MNADGTFELYKDKHGLPLGAIDGSGYHEYEITLPVNGKLFVYTDGVPEAADPQEKMFGAVRMLDTLNANRSTSPEKLLSSVTEVVSAFVGEAEQFDDLTMLCVEYKGGTGKAAAESSETA